MRDGSMNIGYLDEFVYLADSLSFRQTADHFYVSRSVISRHIAALEEAIGARLLERGNRDVSLTEAGRVFYREAKVVLRDWETALERVRAARGDGSVPVRVGYLRNAGRPVLVPFVRHMAGAHPEVSLSLSCLEYNELRRALEDHAVDVALAMNVKPEISRNYRSTLVYEDEFFAVCAPDHPLAALAGPITLDDLRGQKLLLPDSFHDVGLDDLVDGLANDDLPVAQSFYRDFDRLFLKVQTEGYVAFTSGRNIATFGSGVVMLPVGGVNMKFAVSAFYHDDLAGPAFEACAAGFEWCRDALA